jgi:arylsulfatase B
MLRLLLCAAAMACATGASPIKTVLTIILDDLDYHGLGYTGSGIATPALDKLRSEGILLENYWVQTICTPSRAAFLTGRYPSAYGLQGGMTVQPMQDWGTPLNETMLPKALATAWGGEGSSRAVGKWHQGYSKWGYTPTYRGFDSFWGYYLGAEDYYTHSLGPGNGYDLHNDSRPMCGPGCSEVPWQYNGTYSAHLFASEAERVLAAHAENDPSKPLFLFLAFQSVHAPVQAPASYVAPYLNKPGFEEILRATHAGMLAAVDEAVGNVTTAMLAHGLLDSAVIVVTTDNGGPVGLVEPCDDCNGGLNWPLRGGKHSLYDGGVKGTGFVWSQALYGDDASNRTYNGMMHITDFFPTIFSWFGLSNTSYVPAPGFELHGYDMSAALLAAAQGNPDAPSPRTEVLLGLDPTCNGTAAIKIGDMKLILGDPGPPYGWDNATGLSSFADLIAANDFAGSSGHGRRPSLGSACSQDDRRTPPVHEPMWPLGNMTAVLYNVTADPREMNDISAQFPEIVAQMTQALAKWGLQQVRPVQNATSDPRGACSNFNNTWMPWLD